MSARVSPIKKQRKKNIPKALREQIWITKIGRVFEAKCSVSWCSNIITVFDFQCGHNIPESRGGPTTLENLIPICSRCNQSMSDSYTFDRWVSMFSTSQPKQTNSRKTFGTWFRKLFRWNHSS